MILNNYWKWKATMEYFDMNKATRGGDEGSSATNMVDITGSPAQIFKNATSDYWWTNQAPYMLQHFKLHVNIQLQFDGGTGEITGSTYTMPNQISNIATSSLNTAYSANSEDGGSFTIQFSGVNNNSSAITIKRVGIVKRFAWMQYANSGTPNSWVDVLMGTVDLDEPISVNAGDSFSLFIEWGERT